MTLPNKTKFTEGHRNIGGGGIAPPTPQPSWGYSFIFPCILIPELNLSLPCFLCFLGKSQPDVSYIVLIKKCLCSYKKVCSQVERRQSFRQFYYSIGWGRPWPYVILVTICYLSIRFPYKTLFFCYLYLILPLPDSTLR